MRLSLQFGLIEPARDVNWWQKIEDFPKLVLYKNLKWEFIMYAEDSTHKVEYICHFSEVPTYDPTWHATTYESIDHLLNDGYGPKCECGAIYSGFAWDHMRMCPKWVKW